MSFRTFYQGIVLVVLAWLVVGFLLLVSPRNQIDAARGQVWNDLTTGADKIGTLQEQVQSADAHVQQILGDIAAARNDILAAKATGDVNGALEAYGRATVSLNALQEAYPDDTSTIPLYTSLIDETSGAFNRVSRSRQIMIDQQASFNTTCTFFILSCQMLGGRVEVTGAASDPGNSMGITPMNQ